MTKLVAVDTNPFAVAKPPATTAMRLEPVDENPFEAQAPTVPQKPSDNPVQAYKDKFGPDADLDQDERRAFLQGLASWSDEAMAGVKAIPEALTTDRQYWDVYADKVKAEREGLKRLKTHDPDTAFWTEMTGAGTSMFLPALAFEKLRKAGVGIKSALGIVGAGTGANIGAGAADVDPKASWGEAAVARGKNAVVPAAVGAVAAPVVGAVGQYAIGPIAGVTKQAIEYVRDPAQGAYAKMEGRLGEGGADKLFDDLATTKVQKRTLSVLGEEMANAGGDRAAAEAATIARISGEFGIAPGTVKTNLSNLRGQFKDSRLFFSEYPSVAGAEKTARTNRTRAGADVDDVSRIEDTDIHWTLDALANKGMGQSARTARNAINDRAGTANKTLSADIQKMSPNGFRIEDVQDIIDSAEKAAKADYGRVYAPGATLVDNAKLISGMQSVMDKHRGEWAARGGEKKRAIEDALKEFETSVPGGPSIIMPTLQQAQDMRGSLRGIITRNAQAGNSHIVQALQPLYQDVTKVMQDASPEWAAVNAKWADNMARERTQELGEAFSKKAGPKYREQRAEFDVLAPELKDIVRVEYLQRLQDDLDNAIRTGNPAKFFNNNHTYKAIEDLFSKDAAVDFARRTRDFNVEEMSKNMTKGSPTHRRGEMQKQSDADESIVAGIQSASIQNWKDWIFERMKGVLTERKDRELAKIATTPVSDVAKTAEHIHRMKQIPETRRLQAEIPDQYAERYGRIAQEVAPRLQVQSDRSELEDQEKAREKPLFSSGGAVDGLLNHDREQVENYLRRERPELFSWQTDHAQSYDRHPSYFDLGGDELGRFADGGLVGEFRDLGGDDPDDFGYASTGVYDPPRDPGDEAARLPDKAKDIALLLASLAIPGVSIPAWGLRGAAGAYGMLNASTPANSLNDSDLNELRRTLEHEEGPEAKQLRAQLSDAAKRRADIDKQLTTLQASKATANVKSTRDSIVSAEQQQRAAQAEVDRLQGLLTGEVERGRKVAGERADSVMSARRFAEGERDRVRSDQPKPFHQRYGELQKDLPLLPDAALLPYVAGAGTVAATKSLPWLSSWFNRGAAGTLAASDKVDDVAAAVAMADRHAGKPKLLSGQDLGMGAVGGSSFGVLPLTYNSLTQPEKNPERAASEVYANNLLDVDPIKARATEAAKAMPEQNPWYTPRTLEGSGQYGWNMGVAALEGAVGGKAAGLLMEGTKPRYSAVRDAADRYSDKTANEILRMKGAKAYGDQTPDVPTPGPYSPLSAQPIPGAIQGPGAGRQVVAGAGQQQALLPSPPHGPQVSPAIPASVEYDHIVHGPIARQYLDEFLTHGHPTRNRVLGQGRPVEDVMAEDILQRINSAGGVPVPTASKVASRVGSSMAEYNHLTDVLKATNADVTHPRIRQDMLNAVQGRPGMLALPAAVGVGSLTLGDTPSQAGAPRGLGDPAIDDADLARAPDHVKTIRKNSASQYINSRGQYVPLTDAQIFERLKSKGLIGHYKSKLVRASRKD